MYDGWLPFVLLFQAGLLSLKSIFLLWLGSRVAVALALAGSYSSDLTPSLRTSICRGSGLRKGKKTKKKRERERDESVQNSYQVVILNYQLTSIPGRFNTESTQVVTPQEAFPGTFPSCLFC